ncbi:hypothetical protein F3J14_23980 [Burkholderia sp. Tr-862]|nr:hypothetical protein [Burkholderia sp. Tr-862]
MTTSALRSSASPKSHRARVVDRQRLESLPKALGAALLEAPLGDDVTAAISKYRQRRTVELEAELFRQRTRLATAERKLATKVTLCCTAMRPPPSRATLGARTNCRRARDDFSAVCIHH